jgi:1,4-alpha-glucan branching enzyme
MKKATPRKITFTHVNSSARAVSLAGSFNDWNPQSHLLTRQPDGKWATALPLPPGRYEYLFVVDGRWVPDAEAIEWIPNPHGSVNCIIDVK